VAEVYNLIATWEAEIKRIMFEARLSKKNPQDPISTTG
jgi:hypothetical protein